MLPTASRLLTKAQRTRCPSRIVFFDRITASRYSLVFVTGLQMKGYDDPVTDS